METKIIKTDVEIGEFLDYSRIDGRPVRRVTEKELELLSPSEYEIIKMMGDSIQILSEEDQIRNFKNEYLNKQKVESEKDLKSFEIDWDQINSIKDLTEILKLLTDNIVLDFKNENDIEIYKQIKKYLK